MSTKSVRENINQLLSTEMDRTEFLKVCGIATLGVIGVGGLLKALAGGQPKQQSSAADTGAYGGSAYGG